jgi:dTMP kinase
MTRGKLILIEGLDRSGKSTQSAILADKLSQLHKNRSKLLKFPDRSTPIGKIINQYLTDPTFELTDQSAHLLFSANRWELYHEMINLLDDGVFIVLDRYIYSGIAYSLAKLQQNATGSPEMASVDWLYSPDKGLPKPDLTLFLTLDMEELSVRKGWGEERYEKQEFQKSVKTCFLSILDPVKDKSIHFVDVNNKNIEDVTKLIWLVVESTESHFLTDSPVEKLV